MRQRTKAIQSQILRMATQMTGCQVSSRFVHLGCFSHLLVCSQSACWHRIFCR